MKTVNIGVLRNQLSAYLQLVRKGEVIVVCDRNVPIARIVPFTDSNYESYTEPLKATGKSRMPTNGHKAGR
jgi:prevent-host-death family protein